MNFHQAGHTMVPLPRVLKVKGLHHGVETENGKTTDNVEVELILDERVTRATMKYSEVIKIEGGREELAKFRPTFIPSVL